MDFESYPQHIIKDVNIKSQGSTGLVLKMHGFLPQEKVADFSFALRKTLKNDDLSEDITAYLDARLCLARTNKQVLGPDGECQSYMFRKVKIGTWAKTSLREEARFKLRCTVTTSLGRVFVAESPFFEIFSHQSQLPDRKTEKRSERPTFSKRTRTGLIERTPPPLTTPPMPVAAASKRVEEKVPSSPPLITETTDAFGLFSLSDACLKVSASSSDPEDEVEDCNLKRRRLMERADDLQVRIRALKEEEERLREEAEMLMMADECRNERTTDIMDTQPMAMLI